MLTYDKTTSSLYGSQPASTTLAPVVPATNGVRAQPHHRHIWIITGPAGCGKSTVAKYLADQLQLPYVEGDEVCCRRLRNYSCIILTHYLAVPPPAQH